MSRTDPPSVELDTLPLQPQRCMHVLALILRRHNWQHAVKDKGVGHRTAQARGRLCVWVFRFLRDNPVKAFKLDPRSFSGRHADFVLAHWCAEAKAGRLAPATIPTYYSHLKTFTGWIGKPKLLKPIEAYFDDPALYRRSGVTKQDKSWRAAGVDVAAVVRDVEAYDVHAAACLWLMLAFGLRFKESVMLRPHVDVVTARQAAGKSGTDREDADGVDLYLDTHRGTKGGRRRYLPIDDDLCRHALTYARHVAKGVVDMLEVIQIQQHHTECQMVFACMFDDLLETCFEHLAVGQACQSVLLARVARAQLCLAQKSDVTRDAQNTGGCTVAAFDGCEDMVSVLWFLAGDGAHPAEVRVLAGDSNA